MSEEKKPTENEEKKEVKEPEKEEKKPAKTPTVEELMKENEALRKKFLEAEENFEKADKEVEKYKNKYLEAYADMQNVRRMVEKESQDFKEHAIEGFVKELIPSLDAFDMALKKKPEDEAVKKYMEGVEMIHRKLLNALKQCEVEVVTPTVGEDYNPESMNAFSTVPGKEDNKVVDIFVRGYKLKGHLLRPAGVIISTKMDEPVEEEKKDGKSEEKK